MPLFSPASPQETCLLVPKTSDFLTAPTVMLLILGYVCCFTIPVRPINGDLDSFCVFLGYRTHRQKLSWLLIRDALHIFLQRAVQPHSKDRWSILPCHHLHDVAIKQLCDVSRGFLHFKKHWFHVVIVFWFKLFLESHPQKTYTSCYKYNFGDKSLLSDNTESSSVKSNDTTD